jgi:cytochrome c peroxidase
MAPPARHRLIRGTARAACAAIAVGAGVTTPAIAGDDADLAALKAAYQRPDHIPFPDDNPRSAIKVELGKMLFFDARLSGDNQTSCATCHMPEMGWEDGERLTESTGGGNLQRHTPTIWNGAWGRTFFWDGSARSLEEQAVMPITNAAEMAQDMESLLAELRGIDGYARRFAKAFPDSDPAITETNLGKAIATYERTVVQPETPFDAWVKGDADAISPAAKRGFKLFNGKANCAACHSGWNFTAGAFHDIGLPGTDDRGRGRVLDLAAADNMFKTPTLRDIARRAPYMHDGSKPNLQAVLDHYQGGFVRRDTLSADMQVVALTQQEEAELIAFLRTLTTPADTRGVARPELPQ